MLPRDSRMALAAASPAAPRLLAVGMVDSENDQPRIEIVGHVLAGLWQRVDTAEIACLAQVGAQPLVELLHDLVRIAFKLFRAVLGELGDRGLRRIPIARAVLIEVGGGASEPPQRIAKDRRRLRRASRSRA